MTWLVTDACISLNIQVLWETHHVREEIRNKTRVFVSHFVTPGEFYVRVDIEEENFRAMSDKLQNLMASGKLLPLSDLAQDVVCAVNIEGVWRRCRIISFDNELATVSFDRLQNTFESLQNTGFFFLHNPIIESTWLGIGNIKLINVSDLCETATVRNVPRLLTSWIFSKFCQRNFTLKMCSLLYFPLTD